MGVRHSAQYLNAGGEKYCSSCESWLAVDVFPPQSKTWTGLSSWCRPCHAAAVRLHRAAKAPAN